MRITNNYREKILKKEQFFKIIQNVKIMKLNRINKNNNKIKNKNNNNKSNLNQNNNNSNKNNN